MGAFLSPDPFGRQALQQSSQPPPQPGALPRLVVDGVDLHAQAVAELRDGITTGEAATRVKKDGLDEVFFESGGRRFVAYGKGMDISRALEGKVRDGKPTVASFGSDAAHLLAIDNDVNTLKEGAISSVKRSLTWTTIKIGVFAGAGILSAIGAGYLSTAVSAVLHKVKAFTLGIFSSAARLMGTSVPVAGALIGGALFLGDVAYSAFKAQNSRPDLRPIEGIIKEGALQQPPAG